MGSKVNPTVIGAFVVGAIVLTVVGVLLFGGGKFFQEKVLYVIFFDGSVQGLSVGAPVVFRGVQVGQVTQIQALFNPKKTTIDIKVIVELVRGVVHVAEGVMAESQQKAMELLVQHGLRASLQTQSFVTGLLQVGLDFHPDTPIKRFGLDPTLPEIPTVPTEMQELLDDVRKTLADLGKLPIEALLSEVLGTFKRINTLLDLPELRQTLVSLPEVTTEARQLLHNADGQVVSLGGKLGGASDAARTAIETLRLVLGDVQKLVRDVDGQVAPLATGAKDTLTATRSALAQAQKSLVTLTDATTPVLKQTEKTLAVTTALIGPDSPLLNDLERALKALEETAKSIRALTDMLQRNPEVLLRGKSR
jgi:paraquat-inducible protein B